MFLSIDAPTVVCVFMISNSSRVSLPGFFKMASGMLILPMSCSAEAVLMSEISSSERLYRSVLVTSLCSSSSTAT